MQEADRIYYNGRVHTLDQHETIAEAIAIAGSRVLATGQTAAIRSLAAPKAKVIDLRGRAVVPGLIDSHNHMLRTGLNADLVDLSGARSIGEVLAVLKRAAASRPHGDWVTSSSRWHESQLHEARFPTRVELDLAIPAHLVLIRRGGHNIVSNSLTLRLAGIDESTTDPPGGTYVRDASGRLSGHVIGGPAYSRITRRLPPENDAALLSGVRRAMHLFHAAGLTGVIEPGLTPAEMRAYQELHENGELGIRTVVMPRLAPGTTEEELEQAVAALKALPLRTNFGDAMLKIGGIKIGADGGVETNYLREPYAYADDPAAPRGKPQVTAENLAAFCTAAAGLGWQVGIHCVGDAAIDLVLDAYEEADRHDSIGARRWTLIHMTLARPEHFERSRKLKLVLAVQQPLIYALGAGWVKYWGQERAAAASPMKAYLESGLPVGGGSDSPVTPYEPLLGIMSSITRATHLAGVLGPEWGISAADALRLYTTGSAYCSFDEKVRGSLEPNKLADLVVLEADPLRVNPTEIADIEVVQTVVGGKVVFSAGPE
ncbi:MAG: amidohydrolase [Dehalococcoidia bacterium]